MAHSHSRSQFLRNMSRSISFFFFLFILLCPTYSFGQKKSDLESKKKLLQKEIQYTESLLKETKINKKLSLNQLVTLNKKIGMREELIRTINSEIKLIEKQIVEQKDIIDALESDLKKLKEEYARLIYYAYKNQNSYDRLMFIFASEDFNQAFNRLKYLQQYSSYRQHQAQLIVKTRELLDKKIDELKGKKQEKQELLGSEVQEKQNLAKEKGEQEDALGKLQKQEKELLKALKEKNKEQEQLKLAIKRIIEEEIRRMEAEAKKTKGNTTTKSLGLTPEALKLSATFESNKNKLPWPVLEGVITGKFGEHPHPALKGIRINNNGIDITTSKDAGVRAVFDGEVTGIATMPGFGKVVVIRHGEYLSVYGNLREVNVKMGDKITTKQTIGVVDTDDTKSKTEVHLEIWKGTSVLNPELWLFKK